VSQEEPSEVELRGKVTPEERPTSAPGSSTIKVTLSSRRSSEPAKTLSVADARRLENKKASVRELLSRFEESNKSLPPCLRAKAVKSQLASAMSGSLDEKRFAEEAAPLLARVNTLPDVTHSEEEDKEEAESAGAKPPPSPAKPAPSEAIDIPKSPPTSTDVDDPLRRERIER